MKTILKKTIVIEVKRHDYENDFAYVEKWSNAKLIDCFFAEKQYIFPDGTLKYGGIKYFACNPNSTIEKKIVPFNYENFSRFEWLYYFDNDGEIRNIKDQDV